MRKTRRLIEAFLDTDYAVRDGGVWRVVRIGERHPRIEKLVKSTGVFITGWNPFGKRASAAANDARGRTCMIFDEVDAGVGGGVAEMVGRQLHALGGRGQVLCVTHLPQVASQADHQLRVAKLTDGRTSRTAIAELGAGERVEELARMRGGVAITDRAREHAREMLSRPAAAAPVTEAPAASKGRARGAGSRRK